MQRSRYTQYWYIDGKYRIYVVMFRNSEKTSFSGPFHPFRVEPTYILYIPLIHQYRIYPAIKCAQKQYLI